MTQLSYLKDYLSKNFVKNMKIILSLEIKNLACHYYIALRC